MFRGRAPECDGVLNIESIRQEFMCGMNYRRRLGGDNWERPLGDDEVGVWFGLFADDKVGDAVAESEVL